MKFRIRMEALGDLPGGWWCGSGQRSNQALHRCEDKKDADTFDDRETAKDFAKNFRSFGYPCKVRPKQPKP